jgi:acetyl/propionyl-CoA carboxylase alpha subunit
MGDKAAARRQMQAAGVPVIPGYQDGLEQDRELRQAAERVGYPLLIKAAAGGGGKGMRVVQSPEELIELAGAARREARHAFGDDKLIFERYIAHAHHIEMQIFGDHSGKVLHLFERECSVQRRYQKIIEESPSPQLDEMLRTAMGSAAIQAAREVGYTNAGTVEFIFDPVTRDFYFLEMNTRLQVEHPVTELVTGIDLVKWQLRVAAGELLPWEQREIQCRGHALECRLYAEDPGYRFLPASGTVLRFSEPQGPGVRVDAGITSGDEISVHYDPLIAKIIAYGENRTAAIQKMQTALDETVLLGLTSNIQFLQDVLAHPDFIRARVDTTWVEQNFMDWQQPECGIEPEILVAAAFSELYADNPVADQSSVVVDPYSPWQRSDGFRPGTGQDWEVEE